MSPRCPAPVGRMCRGKAVECRGADDPICVPVCQLCQQAVMWHATISQATASSHAPGAGCTSCPSAGSRSSRTAAGEMQSAGSRSSHLRQGGSPTRRQHRSWGTWVQAADELQQVCAQKSPPCTGFCRSAARRSACSVAGPAQWQSGAQLSGPGTPALSLVGTHPPSSCTHSPEHIHKSPPLSSSPLTA